MLSQRLNESLCDQIAKEFYSGYLYMQMAAWFEDTQLEGFGHWMRTQAQEESCHAMIQFNYVLEAGGKVTLGAVAAPPNDFQSPLDIFERTLAHEIEVTKSINAIMDIAIEEHDHATRSFLDWFVDEQVEEEDAANKILGKLKLIKADSNGLFMMDKELAGRVFNVPTPLVGKL